MNRTRSPDQGADLKTLGCAERTAIDDFDVEAVRIGLETRIVGQLIRRFGDELVASMPSSEAVRRLWLANSVGFSPALAPRASRAAEEARRVLRVDDDVQLYQASDGEARACIARTAGGPLHVRVHDLFLTHPDDAVLLFVIGHEIGHHLAHAPSRLRSTDPFLVYDWFARRRRAGVREVAAAFCRAAELTADRIGLLACQDLDAALRTLMILSTGEPGPKLGGSEQAYLAGCRERVEHMLARRSLARGDTHPENDVRAFALWAFFETDHFRSLTGRGAGTKTLAEVDRALERLVGPSESADDEGLPYVPPCLMERAEEELEAARQRAGEMVRSGAEKLYRVGAGVMADLAHRVAPRASAGPPAGVASGRDASLISEDMQSCDEIDELEKRFADLERGTAQQTAAAGAPAARRGPT